MKKLIITTYLIVICFDVNSQNFINNSLNGEINGLSSLPDFWTNVPTYFNYCQASDEGVTNTPDLVDSLGPEPYNGVWGIPYSDDTFVSGELGSDGFYTIWHEGIQQKVSGFKLDQTYTIHFHQSVVKTLACQDNSGSWAVYIDNKLAGISNVIYSQKSYLDKNLDWEAASINFIATKESYTISFLPFDNDNDLAGFSGDTTGALRMGIDEIYIENLKIEMPNVFSPNGDNYNDVFIPMQSESDSLIGIKIYNRWGLEVYASNDLNKGWDGNYQDLPCSEGTYYWLIFYYKHSNIEATASNCCNGFVQLIR